MGDAGLRARLDRISAHMRTQNGPAKAARLLDGLLHGGGARGR
jgi:hypothetical protein